MSNIHFGYEANGKKCDKGCHHGIGDITPETRAARAARMRDIMPEHMPQVMVDFLNDWERCHGKVKYMMGIIGVYEGYYKKENKGQPLKGAIFIANDMPARKPYAD